MREREGEETEEPFTASGRHVFFAVDRGDGGDDKNDKLFKAAMHPSGKLSSRLVRAHVGCVCAISCLVSLG